VTVGAPLAAVDGGYFEVFELGELERTLDLLRNVLDVGAIVTSLAAAAFGRFAAHRIVEPLGPIADAAERISHGDLETRLSAPGDHDLVPLIDSFNAMAESLQARIEREARFASDVSHELRSPLAALRAGIEVIDRRRQELPPAIEPTFDVLAARIRSFETVVLELLEISRLDANAVSLDFEEFEVEEFVRQVLASTGATQAEIEIGAGTPTLMRADRRRLAQAFGTIIDNAALYAGGLTGVSVEEAGGHVRFNLDDSGPGVDPNERRSILQRFARGEAGRRAGGGSGTGLGLALAVAQIDLHGGTIKVESAPTGGARFIVDIPELDGKR
jgi:signal transduction histidine kinase